MKTTPGARWWFSGNSGTDGRFSSIVPPVPGFLGAVVRGCRRLGHPPIYQLTQVVQGLNTSEAYTYDAVGNRLSTVNDTGWAYDSSNHLTSRPGVSYTYDRNGNTATKVDSNGTTTYAWDYENRLTSVTLPGTGGTVTFKYDPFGRRIQKVSPTAGTTNYLYDGANAIEEVDGTGTVLARYSQGPGIDQPLSDVTGGNTKYYDADGLGSITSLANISGSLTDSYVTDSFGKTTASSGTTRNPYRYTARDFDSETGLYYYRARYYDSAAGRFLSEDPTRFHSGVNFYRYAHNSPTNFVDPLGLQTVVIVTTDTTAGVTYGSHTAVYLTNTSEGGTLYDPAGSYGGTKRPENGLFNAVDDDVSLADYVKYQQQTGSKVQTFTFDTTQQEEDQVLHNAEKIGDHRGFSCAKSVSTAISGVGPFGDIKPTGWPGSLAEQLRNLQLSVAIQQLGSLVIHTAF